jgi:Vps16, N-terminal region
MYACLSLQIYNKFTYNIKICKYFAPLFFDSLEDASRNVFQVGSTHPGALLFSAYEYHKLGVPKSVELIDELLKTEKLFDAVMCCINAAVEEISTELQKHLLRAALLGRNFLGFSINLSRKVTDEFKRTCDIVRFLNTVRDPLSRYPENSFDLKFNDSGIIIPFVYHTGNFACREYIITLLASAGRYGLAQKTCERVFKFSIGRVLDLWLTEELSSKLLNEAKCTKLAETTAAVLAKNQIPELREIVFSKLGRGPSCFTKKLAEFLNDPVLRVEILLQVGLWKQALLFAVESGNESQGSLLFISISIFLFLFFFFTL